MTLNEGKKNAIAVIVDAMHQYQRKHNIKKQCITNTQYLYDSIKASFPCLDVKTKAIIGFRNNDKILGVDEKSQKKYVNRETYTVVHMVVLIDDKIIFDPSAEINDMEDLDYVGREFKGLIKTLRELGMCEEMINTLIKQYMLFLGYEKKMNNGEGLVVDRQYYNNQADYVEETMMKTI
jgi:hypothetical protein